MSTFRMIPDWLIEDSSVNDATKCLYLAIARAVREHGDHLTHEQIAIAGGHGSAAGGVQWVRRWLPLLRAAKGVWFEQTRRGCRYLLADPRQPRPTASPPVSSHGWVDTSGYAQVSTQNQAPSMGVGGDVSSETPSERQERDGARVREAEPRPIARVADEVRELVARQAPVVDAFSFDDGELGQADDWHESFKAFWEAFPPCRRNGEGSAAATWRDMSAAEREKSMSVVGEYRRAVEAAPDSERKYFPTAHKWLLKRGWNDDPASWWTQAGASPNSLADRNVERPAPTVTPEARARLEARYAAMTKPRGEQSA